MNPPKKTVLEIMTEACVNHMGIGQAWEHRTKANQDALIAAIRAAVQAMPDVMTYRGAGSVPVFVELSSVRDAIIAEQMAHRPIGVDEEVS